MRNRALDTRWLTQASFAPTAPRPRARRWPLAGAAVLLLVLVAAARGVFGDLFVTAGELAAAREQQALLAAEVERLRTQLAVEGATRGELERQAAALNDQVAQLTRQVEFLTARRRPATRAD